MSERSLSIQEQAAQSPTTECSTLAGFLIHAMMFFSSDQSILSGWDGFLAVGLHELGHTMGLGDLGGQGGSSVMNQMSGPNDPLGYISRYVTDCDASAAMEYSGGGGDPDCSCTGCYNALDGYICQPYDVYDPFTGCCKIRSTPWC